MLLLDDSIDEKLVCKEYKPISEAYREELFENFKREIKILFQINHPNLVRYFNHYIYPDKKTGYYLMEYIHGDIIEDYIPKFPQRTNEIFRQLINGFHYLESQGILHRDIRPGNIMVCEDHQLKIIDLGFGKKIQNSSDFERSVSLNWCCDVPPGEFQEQKYDFRTEVYFVGKLFEGLFRKNHIENFRYHAVLSSMCNAMPDERIGTFSDVLKKIQNEGFSEDNLSNSELQNYRDFSEKISEHIVRIEENAKYISDVRDVQSMLEDVLRRVSFEVNVPDFNVIIRCFVDGSFQSNRDGFPVDCLRNMVRLMQSSSMERRRQILDNLQTKLDAIGRYNEEDFRFSY